MVEPVVTAAKKLSILRMGAGSALRLAVRCRLLAAYQPLPELGVRVVSSREKAVYARWEAIRAELGEPGSVLDIGCNLGFYAFEAARAGHLAFGLDVPRYAAALALARFASGRPEVVPISLRLAPRHVQILPIFDRVICLQVFHHLCADYGEEQATHILGGIWNRTGRKLFLESEWGESAGERFRTRMPPPGNGFEAWCRAFFGQRGAARVECIYSDSGRGRSLLVIAR